MKNVNFREILNAVAEKYRSCSTYVDQGRLSLNGIEPDQDGVRKSVQDFSFQIEFHRPFDFRFSLTTPISHRLSFLDFFLTAEEERVAVFFPDSCDVSMESSINDAVTKTTGISFGLTHLICKLLLPEQVKGTSIVERLSHGSWIHPVQPTGNFARMMLRSSSTEIMDVTIRTSDFSIINVSTTLAISPLSIRRSMTRMQECNWDLWRTNLESIETSISFNPQFN